MIHTALSIAISVHQGEVDQEGQPIILHVLRVMLKGSTEAERIVGVLHDVGETDPERLPMIYDVFGVEIGDAVDAISRRKKEKYEVYILRVSKNRLATQVKLYDLGDNTDPNRMRKLPPRTVAFLNSKYVPAKQLLSHPPVSTKIS